MLNRVIILVLLSMALVGCQSQEMLAEFGDLRVHSFYARAAGAPAVTGIVAERPAKEALASCAKVVEEGAEQPDKWAGSHSKIRAMFSQKDLATTAMEGFWGAAGSALNGMTFGMFREPDVYESHDSVNVEAGGDAGSSSGASSASASSSDATSKSKSGATSKSKSKAKGKPKGPKKPKKCKPKKPKGKKCKPKPKKPKKCKPKPKKCKPKKPKKCKPKGGQE